MFVVTVESQTCVVCAGACVGGSRCACLLWGRAVTRCVFTALPCLLPAWPALEPVLLDQGSDGGEKTDEATAEPTVGGPRVSWAGLLTACPSWPWVLLPPWAGGLPQCPAAEGLPCSVGLGEASAGLPCCFSSRGRFRRNLGTPRSGPTWTLQRRT